MAYILAVGINRYANQDYDLKYAVPDAEALAAELHRQQVRLRTFADVRTVVLRDAEATRDNILRAFRRLSGNESGSVPAGVPPQIERLAAARVDDTVFVYFAGHGSAQGEVRSEGV